MLAGFFDAFGHLYDHAEAYIFFPIVIMFIYSVIIDRVKGAAIIPYPQNDFLLFG